MIKMSIWRGTAESSDFECLQGKISCEVAIIGGGITGITAGYLLRKQGISSVILESLRVGGGTTGFSTGNLYSTVDEFLHSIKSRYDLDKVKQVWQSRQQAMNLIKGLVSEFKIDCELIEAPFFLFASQEKKVEKVEKEYEVAGEAGLNASLQDHIDLPLPVTKALRLEGQAQFNPMKYIRQLGKHVHGKECTIYEVTKVLSYELEHGTYQIKTEKGVVHAKHIIMATHTPKGVLGIQTLLFPYREYAVAFDYKEDYMPGIFWGIDSENKHSIRNYRNDSENYLLVLGEKHKTGQQENKLMNIERLKEFADQNFSIGNLRYQWGAQHYRSSDGLPTVGKPDKDAEVYIATGFSTDGLVYGTMAAQIITDRIAGKDNPYAETYSPHRHHPLQSAGQFIKENINVLAQYLKDFPGVADVKEAEQVKAGQGKIISQKGEKLAVYRDEENKLHVCSAVCTHMDCIVTWNQAERTWDCPCHGSRFNYDGTVLEGPAITDLAKRKIN
jgi:glycine/D-amino acid oxidase-like deaminating enzyme/nitrite reductase/ring-hydroxylating ferredoxin subunit